MKRVAALVLLGFCLVGCGPKDIRVTYTSTPTGAALYQNGVFMGLTPFVMAYPIYEGTGGPGKTKIMGASVKWPSGATASVSDMILPAKGAHYYHVFARPAGVDGLDIDLANANQQIGAAQAAAQAQRAHDAQVYQNMANTIQQMNRPPQTSTSTYNGVTIHTTHW